MVSFNIRYFFDKFLIVEIAMKILLVTNRKGGVGKTTIACHAAWYFGQTKRVLFVELDTQRNASQTLHSDEIDLKTSDLLNRKVIIPSREQVGISVIAADDALKSIVVSPKDHMTHLRANILAAKDYDLCIFDAAPAADTLNIGPMLFATHVLAPIMLTKYSLQGIESLLQSIVGMQQQYNKDLKFLGMLPNQYIANSPNQKAALKDLFERVGDQFMFDAVLSQRQAYEYATAVGKPAWDDPKTASRIAGKEIRGVMEKIEQRMFVS